MDPRIEYNWTEYLNVIGLTHMMTNMEKEVQSRSRL